MSFDGRKAVGDNPNDITDKKYGNNNVIGPDPKDAKHGTHVAGIIAQARSNKKGGDGVINNVSIMAVRAVPNGDEYDKDIALGIRYAVDNGAKVINGSFGKYFSKGLPSSSKDDSGGGSNFEELLGITDSNCINGSVG